MLRRRPKSPEQRAVEAERADWSRQWNRCWACGTSALYAFPPHQTHELVRRGETKYALDARAYIRLCEPCHNESHGGWLTKNVLLSLKMILDGSNFDPDWLRANGVLKGIEPGPLPPQCDWLWSDALLNERQG